MIGLGRFLGKRRTPEPPRRRLALGAMPDLVYAIGDVHGCLDQLLQIEDQILAHAAPAGARKLIVMVGDYVDRGPQSRDVVEHLTGPPPAGFERICLAGNHEQAMLEFMDGTEGSMPWLEFGGIETLASYGIETSRLPRPGSKAFGYLLDSHIPEEHLAFLRDLPAMLSMPGWVFAHAGIRPHVAIEAQTDRDLLWIRSDFLNAPELGIDARVVHGHTPVGEPQVLPTRIGIDTGAYMTGRLTAVRLTAEGEISFLHSK